MSRRLDFPVIEAGNPIAPGIIVQLFVPNGAIARETTRSAVGQASVAEFFIDGYVGQAEFPHARRIKKQAIQAVAAACDAVEPVPEATANTPEEQRAAIWEISCSIRKIQRSSRQAKRNIVPICPVPEK
jgi:hypothetical protein